MMNNLKRESQNNSIYNHLKEKKMHRKHAYGDKPSTAQRLEAVSE